MASNTGSEPMIHQINPQEWFIGPVKHEEDALRWFFWTSTSEALRHVTIRGVEVVVPHGDGFVLRARSAVAP